MNRPERDTLRKYAGATLLIAGMLGSAYVVQVLMVLGVGILPAFLAGLVMIAGIANTCCLVAGIPFWVAIHR